MDVTVAYSPVANVYRGEGGKNYSYATACVVTVRSYSTGQVALRSIAAAVGGAKRVRDVGGVAFIAGFIIPLI